MNTARDPDLHALLFALALCATFGALFAFVLAVPFWLGFAMVGSALFALGVVRGRGEAPMRRRPARRPSLAERAHSH